MSKFTCISRLLFTLDLPGTNTHLFRVKPSRILCVNSAMPKSRFVFFPNFSIVTVYSDFPCKFILYNLDSRYLILPSYSTSTGISAFFMDEKTGSISRNGNGVPIVAICKNACGKETEKSASLQFCTIIKPSFIVEKLYIS